MRKKFNDILMWTSVFVIVLAVVFFIRGLITTQRTTTQSQGESLFSLNTETVSSQSTYIEDSEAAFFYITMESPEAGFFSLSNNSTDEVMKFIDAKPMFSDEGNIQYQGTGEGVRQLIPDDVDNLSLVEAVRDDGNGLAQSLNLSSPATHYYFTQERCDVPVFGSHVNIHVGPNNNVYVLSGALTKEDVDCTVNIQETQVRQTAIDQLKEDLGGDPQVIINSIERYVLNTHIAGIESETANYLTDAVTACSSDNFCTLYFIDLNKGNIVFKFNLTQEAVNRSVQKGTIRRTEGQPAVSDQKVNEIYDLFGRIYDHYSTNFQRDGLNGSGSTTVGILRTCGTNYDAQWTGASISICEELLADDVVTHEYQHGVTQYAVGGSGLIYTYQSGALSEGLSDIFAHSLDRDNWTMGEDTPLGVIRDMAHPPDIANQRYKQPDRLFSPIYYCATTAIKSTDYGGVHKNNGIINKIYYLIVQGETFNNRTVTGIGEDKAVKIVYRALTTYLRGKNSANFRDFYDAMTSACNDLHTSTSAECESVKSAMQATEIDQQPVGSVKSPVCSGGSSSPAPTSSTTRTATPSGVITPSGSVTPSGTVSPNPSVSQSPSPTSSSSQRSITSPLKSVVSAPAGMTGNVEITYDGATARVTATLEGSAFTALFGEDRALDSTDLSLKGRLKGPDTIETGQFRQEGGKLINRYSVGKDLSKYQTFEIIALGESSAEIPVFLADLTPDTSSQGQQNDVILDISLRLQGIDKKPRSTQAIMVRVGVDGGDLEGPLYTHVPFIPQDNGIWKAKAVFSARDLKEGEGYNVKIKAGRHVQKKYCVAVPEESAAGLYKCEENAITLRKGVNTLDFSKVVQLAGDLAVPKQDGIVNSMDIIRIRQSLSSTEFADLAVADVNSDGVINSVDDALVIFTLSNRSDQM